MLKCQYDELLTKHEALLNKDWDRDELLGGIWDHEKALKYDVLVKQFVKLAAEHDALLKEAERRSVGWSEAIDEHQVTLGQLGESATKLTLLQAQFAKLEGEHAKLQKAAGEAEVGWSEAIEEHQATRDQFSEWKGHLKTYVLIDARNNLSVKQQLAEIEVALLNLRGTLAKAEVTPESLADALG